jgi:hypothetical protein
MNANQRDTMTHQAASPKPAARAREDERRHRQERRRHVTAAEMAAPSTRRWRRAGRFSAS